MGERGVRNAEVAGSIPVSSTSLRWISFLSRVQIMGNFLGGSAFAMATQIAGGYMLVTSMTLRRLSRQELNQLKHELNKVMTDERGRQPSQDDTQALQGRNRKISRINNALQVIQARIAGR